MDSSEKADEDSAKALLYDLAAVNKSTEATGKEGSPDNLTKRKTSYEKDLSSSDNASQFEGLSISFHDIREALNTSNSSADNIRQATILRTMHHDIQTNLTTSNGKDFSSGARPLSKYADVDGYDTSATSEHKQTNGKEDTSTVRNPRARKTLDERFSTMADKSRQVDRNTSTKTIKGHFNSRISKAKSVRSEIIQDSKQPEISEKMMEYECDICCTKNKPLTLTCSHMLCNSCVSKGYLDKEKMECPTCFQFYKNLPVLKYLFRLKNIRLKKQGEEREKREAELAKVFVQQAEIQKKQTDQPVSIPFLLVAGFCVFIFYTLIDGYIRSHKDNSPSLKPVQTWTSRDVAMWLREKDWASQYAPSVVKNNIDGNMLLSEDADSLIQMMNVTDYSVERALIHSIKHITEHGVKMPKSLFSYQQLYPGRSLLLFFGMRHFPRTCVLYVWMFFYEDMFVPVLKTLSQSTSEKLSQATEVLNMIGYILMVAFLPEIFLVLFLWPFVSHDVLVLFYVMGIAIVYMVNEYLTYASIILNFDSWRMFHGVLGCMKKVFTAKFILLVWPFIPNLASTAFFYFILFLSPYFTLKILPLKIAHF